MGASVKLALDGGCTPLERSNLQLLLDGQGVQWSVALSHGVSIYAKSLSGEGKSSKCYALVTLRLVYCKMLFLD